eukprot:Hpha_TRINITY_DN718_c0_g2::TRINITY_DN718_c0_g2_i1::g.29009::m.29009
MEAMGKCWSKCSSWVVRESDSAESLHIKRTLTPLLILLIPFHIANIWSDTHPLRKTVHATNAFFYIAYLVRARLGFDMVMTLDVTLIVLAVTNVLFDVVQAAEARERTWQQAVLYLDLALVFNRPHLTPCIIVGTLAWLLVESSESAFRLGLYDLVSGTDTLGVCDCTNTPCASDLLVALGSSIAGGMVLLIDFYLTRRFATNLSLQFRRVEVSVEVAVEIASALAKYDVDTAETAIAHGSDLPEELAESFRQL